MREEVEIFQHEHHTPPAAFEHPEHLAHERDVLREPSRAAELELLPRGAQLFRDLL